MGDLLRARNLIASKLAPAAGAMSLSYVSTARDYE
jgi:hypothetical protein